MYHLFELSKPPPSFSFFLLLFPTTPLPSHHIPHVQMVQIRYLYNLLPGENILFDLFLIIVDGFAYDFEDLHDFGRAVVLFDGLFYPEDAVGDEVEVDEELGDDLDEEVAEGGGEGGVQGEQVGEDEVLFFVGGGGGRKGRGGGGGVEVEGEQGLEGEQVEYGRALCGDGLEGLLEGED